MTDIIDRPAMQGRKVSDTALSSGAAAGVVRIGGVDAAVVLVVAVLVGMGLRTWR